MNQDRFQEIVLEKFDETCNRLTKLEQKVEDHIDLKIKSSEKKYQVITAILGVLTTVSSLVAIFK